ncbi:MAG TPA: DUF2501 domain-containing protein [Sphingomicrobium sp.]
MSGAATDAVLDSMTSKPDPKSNDYLAGAGGQVLGDEGKNFAIAQAPSYLQSQVCNMVLDQVKSSRTAP